MREDAFYNLFALRIRRLLRESRVNPETLQEIRLIAGQKKLCITGKELRIDSYSREEIEISGTIEKLEYL